MHTDTLATYVVCVCARACVLACLFVCYVMLHSSMLYTSLCDAKLRCAMLPYGVPCFGVSCLIMIGCTKRLFATPVCMQCMHAHLRMNVCLYA